MSNTTLMSMRHRMSRYGTRLPIVDSIPAVFVQLPAAADSRGIRIKLRTDILLTALQPARCSFDGATEGLRRLVHLTFANWWTGVGRRWVLYPNTEVLTRLFTLPTHPLIQGILHSDSSWRWAVFCTTTTKPAFIRIHDNGRLAFLQIG
jgi:hypothetical protein